ncbi:MAG: hypothetical protein ABJN26_22565 [Stappiaceae bacterium]
MKSTAAEKPQVKITSPPAQADFPDSETSKNPDYAADANAEGRVFHFNKWGVKYGVDDKGHAASIILSIILALLLAFVFLVGAFADRSWISDAIKILGTAFTLTAGVAIGKSSSKGNSK